MIPCAHPSCRGHVDDTGFCDTCGRAPVPAQRSAPARTGPSAPPPPASPPPVAGSERWTIAGLVSLPVLSFGDPATRQRGNLEVPESSRLCGNPSCRQPVGRGYGGQPGLTEGHCSRCRTYFSFVPGLREGDLVADRYEIVRCVARGGMGWVYLARDRHLDGAEVALKGLISTNDPVAVELAVAERRFLISLDHPNIVRILNFVTHREPVSGVPTGYLVMEFLNGMSLRELINAAESAPLPLEHVLAYGHEILAALDYLHGRGLLYCDMKPDNVIRTADRIKVIDLGGVRRIGDEQAVVVGTPGYQVAEEEIRTHGLTVRSDLYAVGRTLNALFQAGASHHAEADGGLGVESFRRLVARATDPDRARRFASAAEMSEQLKGVLREVLAPRRDAHAEPSTVFAPAEALLDAGLGAVPPLEAWTRPRGDGLLDDGCPPPAAVAAGLPAPWPDPHDPAATTLLELTAPDPRGLIGKLAAIEPESAEVRLRRCRAYLVLSEPDPARADLAAAADLIGDAGDWRLIWHRGLLALVEGKLEAAYGHFDDVYAALPGELAPKLALGYCAERLGRPEQAQRYYRAVWRRDRTQASAAFGLARLRLAAGDRSGAVALLDEVPRVSRHYDAARTAAVRIYSGRLPSGLPSAAELAEAVRRLPELHLDGGDPTGEARDRLTAAIREVALERALAHGGPGAAPVRGPAAALPAGDTDVLGGQPTELDLRLRLEQSFRALARQARSAADHGVLVDRANAVRPRSWT